MKRNHLRPKWFKPKALPWKLWIGDLWCIAKMHARRDPKRHTVHMTPFGIKIDRTETERILDNAGITRAEYEAGFGEVPDTYDIAKHPKADIGEPPSIYPDLDDRDCR